MTTKTIRTAFLAGAALAFAPVSFSNAAVVFDGDDGWADVDAVWGAKARNITHNNGDWVVNVGPTPGAVTSTTRGTWAASGEANEFTLAYQAATRSISLDWNGASRSWNAAADAASIVIQLVSRNKSGSTLSMALHDLTFNGDALDTGAFAGFASAGTNEFSWIQIGGQDLAGDWTLQGSLTATWTGKTPSRDLARVEFIGSTQAAPGGDVPSPGASGLAAIGLALTAGRRRRDR